MDLELFLSSEGWGMSFFGKIPEPARRYPDLGRARVDQNLTVRVWKDPGSLVVKFLSC